MGERMWRIKLLLLFLLPASALAADPVQLMVENGSSLDQIRLRWSGGTQPYRVFRSTSPRTVTAPSSTLGERQGLDWIDEDPQAPILYYQVLQSAHDVDVQSFGAACDSDDDTQAFVAAVATAGQGGRIFVPGCSSGAAGTYLVSGGILLQQGQRLQGLSREATVISCATPSDIGVAADTDGDQYLAVTDLSIRNCAIAIDARAVQHSRFENLYLLNNGRGIYLGRRTSGGTGTFWNEFRNIRVSGSTLRALEVDLSLGQEALVNANLFMANVFEDSQSGSSFKGLGGNGLPANAFISNTWESGESILFSNVSGLVLQGNYFEGSAINTPQLGLGSNVFGASIVGNYFNNPDVAQASIRIGINSGAAVRGVRIDGNYFAGHGCEVPSADKCTCLAHQTAILVDPDLDSSSGGIAIGPNEYASICPLSDGAGRACSWRCN